MYENIQEQILKRIRRGVLVTGQKFDWDRPVGLIM
jgi:DNA-binding GntR family transcriptional regulator